MVWKTFYIFIFLFKFGICQNRERQQLAFAEKVSKLLINQSTEQNLEWEKSFEELRKLSSPLLAVEVFCDRMHYEPFLDYLNRTRGKLDIVDANAEIRADFKNSTFQQFRFDVSFALINPMHFLVIESFKMIAMENDRNEWMLVDVIAIGACLHSMNIKQRNIIDLWRIRDKNGDDENKWMFAENVSLVLPFLEFEPDRELTLNYDLFHPKCTYTIGNNITYHFNQFISFDRIQVIMTRFARRFTSQPRISQPEIALISSVSDHFVFQSRRVVRYANGVNETWQFQMEAVFNSDGNKTWLITQLHIIGPTEFLTSLQFLLDLKQVFLDNQKTRRKKVGCSEIVENLREFLGENEEARIVVDILTWRPRANFELTFYYSRQEFVNIWLHADYNRKTEKYTIQDYHLCIPTMFATPVMLDILDKNYRIFKTNSGFCGKINHV